MYPFILGNEGGRCNAHVLTLSERWAGYGPCTPSYCSEGGWGQANVPPDSKEGGGKSPRTISFQEGGAYVPPHSRKCGGNNKMSTIYIIFINAKIEVLNKLLQTRDSLDKPLQTRDSQQTRDSLDKPQQTRDSLDKPLQTGDSLDKPLHTRDSLNKPLQTRDSLNKPLQTRDSLDKQEKYFIVLNLQSV